MVPLSLELLEFLLVVQVFLVLYMQVVLVVLVLDLLD